MIANAWLASIRTGLIAHPDLSRGYVRVECAPCGEAIFHASTVDVFQPNTLTITDADGEELRTFAPGTWANATEYDSRGNVQCVIYAGQPAESRRAS